MCPILDIRTYTDNLGDFHTYIHSYIVRERLRKTTGSAGNQVMWRAAPTTSGAMITAARVTMAAWLDNIAAGTSFTVRAGRSSCAPSCPRRSTPAGTSRGGESTSRRRLTPAGSARTSTRRPSTPRLRAGSPLESGVTQCRLRHVRLSEYGVPITPGQAEHLRTVFPDGVCDYVRRGVGRRRMKETWLSYGD